ncbi:MAG: hypothetical protein ACW98Y_06520, partial [Candidatus Thorarchaeota archaeon]
MTTRRGSRPRKRKDQFEGKMGSLVWPDLEDYDSIKTAKILIHPNEYDDLSVLKKFTNVETLRIQTIQQGLVKQSEERRLDVDSLSSLESLRTLSFVDPIGRLDLKPLSDLTSLFFLSITTRKRLRGAEFTFKITPSEEEGGFDQHEIIRGQ